jgi:hypothetical protein
MNRRVIITPAGPFHVQPHPDGSIEIVAPPEGARFLSPLMWTFLLEVFPGWSCSSQTGRMILRPPDAT